MDSEPTINRINVGDKVRVSLAGTSVIEGVVIYIPCMTGDVWIIETDKDIVYVQNFQMIWKVKFS